MEEDTPGPALASARACKGVKRCTNPQSYAQAPNTYAYTHSSQKTECSAEMVEDQIKVKARWYSSTRMDMMANFDCQPHGI